MDMTRISTCSIPLRDRPVDEAFAVIADAGFKKVDLLGRMPHFSLDPAELAPETIQAAAEKRGLRIANLGTYVGSKFVSDDETELARELDDLKRAVDLAVFFGARSIRVMPGLSLIHI